MQAHGTPLGPRGWDAPRLALSADEQGVVDSQVAPLVLLWPFASDLQEHQPVHGVLRRALRPCLTTGCVPVLEAYKAWGGTMRTRTPLALTPQQHRENGQRTCAHWHGSSSSYT